MDKDFDVVVFGGGSAGVVAAIQSARAGAKTLLVEKTGLFGGTTTNGGVNFPGLFHAWGQQVIAGIGWELISRCVEEAGTSMPDFTDYNRPHWQLQIRVDRFLFSALSDEMLVDAGVTILFHVMLAGLEQEEHGSWKVLVCTKTGLEELKAAVIIDTTGDANAAAIADLPLRYHENNQPATLAYEVSGYDLDRLDLDAINAAFDAAVKAGNLKYTDASWNAAAPDVGRWLRQKGVQSNHIYHEAAHDSAGKSLLELESRRSLLRMYRFLRKQPGLENLKIEGFAPECGVRETVTIRGRVTVTVEDYTSGRVWEDALCYAFYPIDLHKFSDEGLDCKPLTVGTVPTVPRRALIPEGSRNFLIAGRCISSDRLANSALRVQSTAMATGQAAGVVAALAASTGSDPADVPMPAVRQMLRDHGAIVPNTPSNGAID